MGKTKLEISSEIYAFMICEQIFFPDASMLLMMEFHTFFHFLQLNWNALNKYAFLIFELGGHDWG